MKRIFLLLLTFLTPACFPNVKITPAMSAITHQSKYVKYTLDNTSPFTAYVKIKVLEKQCPNHKIDCQNYQLNETDLSKQFSLNNQRFIIPKHSIRIISGKFRSKIPKTSNRCNILL